MKTTEPHADLVATPELSETAAGAPTDVAKRRKRFESLHFALRNRKLIVGASVLLALLILAIVGPWLTDGDPFAFGAPLGQPPSRAYWLGTTSAGQDVFVQFVLSLIHI